jgi:MerR family transcriptional regulator/heat shock protein HspR
VPGRSPTSIGAPRGPVAALAARNEELVAELDATREALREALAGRPRPPGKLPAVRQPDRGQSVVVWRRGR